MDRLGQQIGDYRLTALADPAGSDRVYRAVQAKSDRVVAVKFSGPRKADAWSPELTRMRSQHVLPVYGTGDADGDSYLVMGYVEGGRSVRSLLDRDRTLSPDLAMRIAGEIALGLQDAHREGFAFGGLDPDRVLLERVRGETRVQLSPAGLHQSDDTAADVHALGAVIYKMLTGRPPHAGEALSTGLGTPANRILARALSKDPMDRPRYPLALIRELSITLEPPVAAMVAAPVEDPDANLRERFRRAAAQGIVPLQPSGQVATAEPWPMLPSHAEMAERAGRVMMRRTSRAVPVALAATFFVAGLAVVAKYVFGWFVAPVDPPPPSPPPESPEELIDVTVFAPAAAAPGNHIRVQVFAHLPLEDRDVRALAAEFDTATGARNFKSLKAPVNRGDELVFQLRMPGAEIADPVDSLVWQGRAQPVQFGVVIPEDVGQPGLDGVVEVYRSNIPLGRVKFSIEVDRTARHAELSPLGIDVHRYRYAFISYASADRAEMLKFLQGFEFAGVRYFTDIFSLSPGERWKRRIEAGIDDCDLFVVIWSRQAKGSEYVKLEVTHALERQGDDSEASPKFHPVPVESPVVPPWEGISEERHFNNHLWLAARSAETAAGADEP